MQGILGVLVFLLLAYSLSERRQDVEWRFVVVGLTSASRIGCRAP